jgi:hypothetical protein
VITNFEEFAKVDVYTGDIDPTYWAIHRARSVFGHGWATRFAVAMLCYYHTGTAAQAADYEGDDFWSFINDQYKTAPRAAERRHWRGQQGINSLNSMYQFSPNPDEFFQKIADKSEGYYWGVKKVCENHLKGFGAYFVLKICDYMDRCLDLPINQKYAGLDVNLPTLPAQAASLLCPGEPIPRAFLIACARVQELGLLAPPLFDRPVGPAEVETILCDWKRAKYGNHVVGDDVADKRESLVGYGPHAERMIELFPPAFPLNTFRCEFRD